MASLSISRIMIMFEDKRNKSKEVSRNILDLQKNQPSQSQDGFYFKIRLKNLRGKWGNCDDEMKSYFCIFTVAMVSILFAFSVLCWKLLFLKMSTFFLKFLCNTAMDLLNIFYSPLQAFDFDILNHQPFNKPRGPCYKTHYDRKKFMADFCLNKWFKFAINETTKAFFWYRG